MSANFQAWIDVGREVNTVEGRNILGARWPMNISFNEWMMSQCDGFVAIVPKRSSNYQALEYELAARMGLPRLVIRQGGSEFSAPPDELLEVPEPTQWAYYWSDDTQARIRSKVDEFAAAIAKHKSAAKVFKDLGHWQPRRTVDHLRVALLPPRTGDTDWNRLQELLDYAMPGAWELIPPTNLLSERDLVRREFDILVVDVGPLGTPKEMLGYIHAVGVPLIRLCRISSSSERADLARYLDQNSPERRSRFAISERETSEVSTLPRFLDRTQVDSQMEPVYFWVNADDVAHRILNTIRRVQLFRSLRSPEDGGIAQDIGTHESARQYFDAQLGPAEQGSVFISYSGRGQAAELAERLARVLRFLNFRCFNYREEDDESDARLESGEDIEEGLAVRVAGTDIAVYLIEENFLQSSYCTDELQQGVHLRDQGRLEVRPYSLDSTVQYPTSLAGISSHVFRNRSWGHSDVLQKIVSDVSASAKRIRWVLRDGDRSILAQWLEHDDRATLEGIKSLLEGMGVENEELDRLQPRSDQADWFDAFLRLPTDETERRRSRKLVALLLLALAAEDPGRLKQVRSWLRERRLVGMPSVLAEPEDIVEVDKSIIDQTPTTLEAMREIGVKLAQWYPNTVVGHEPLCVLAKTDFLSTPIEWACETMDDEPVSVRRPVRWRLSGPSAARPSLFEEIAGGCLPPRAQVLGLEGADISAAEQVRRAADRLRERYSTLNWPTELVAAAVCKTEGDLLSRLASTTSQIVLLAGHMGSDGLQIGEQLIDPGMVALAVRNSDIRLLVLNGCQGAQAGSPIATAYLTLADRLVRDGRVAEVVAHRRKVTESDAIAFADAYFAEYLKLEGGFDSARAVYEARRSGSRDLRYWPIVISDRPLVSAA